MSNYDKHQPFPVNDFKFDVSPQKIADYTLKAQKLRSQAFSETFSAFSKVISNLALDLRQLFSPVSHGAK